jgi:hypothetical protein
MILTAPFVPVMFDEDEVMLSNNEGIDLVLTRDDLITLLAKMDEIKQRG